MKRYMKLFEQFGEESIKYELGEALDREPDIPFVYFAVVDGKVKGFVTAEWATDTMMRNSIMEVYGDELEEKWREELTEAGEDYEEFMFDPTLNDIMEMGDAIDSILVQFDMKTGEMMDYYNDEDVEDKDLREEIFELFGQTAERWKKMLRGKKMFGV